MESKATSLFVLPHTLELFRLSRAWLIGVAVTFVLIVTCSFSPGETTNEINRLQQLCEKLIVHQPNLVEAQPIVQKLLALTLEHYGELHPETVVALHWTAFVANRTGRSDEAERIWKRSLALQEELPTCDTLWYTRTLNMLAVIYTDQGDFLRAEEVFRWSLALRENAFGSDHPEAANVVHTLGDLYIEMGDRARAESFYLRALRVFEQGGPDTETNLLKSLHAVGLLYMDQSKYQKAELVLQSSLALEEKAVGFQHPKTATVVHMLGQLHHRVGNRARAESLYLRALRVFEQAGPGYTANVLESLNALGQLCSEMGDLDQAESLLTRALAMSEKKYGPESGNQADILHHLATTLTLRGEYNRARALFERSMVLRGKQSGPEDIQIAWPLMSMAYLCEQGGEFSRAEALYLRHKAIVEKDFGANHPGLTWVWRRLGLIYERRGETLKARDCFARACQLSSNPSVSSRRSAISSQRSLAVLQFALGETDAALAAADEIQNGEELHIADMLSFASERQRMLLWNHSLSDDRFGLWASLGATRPLARAVLRTKGLVLDSILEDRELAEAGDDPEIREMVRDMQSIKSRLDPLYSEVDPAFYSTNRPPHAYLESLAKKSESTLSVLTSKVAGLGKARRALNVRLEQVQRAIPPDAALLEFIRYPKYLGSGQWHDNYGVLVLTERGEPKWVTLAEAEDVERNLKLYQHLVREKAEDSALESLLRCLYVQLWLPLITILPTQIQQVYVCPDAQLNFLSFATLLTSSNRFLGEDLSISYVSSGRDLLAQTLPSPTPLQLSVWANPDFDAAFQDYSIPPPFESDRRAAAAGGRRNLDLRPLPGAEIEGKLLSQNATKIGFDHAVLHLGAFATEYELFRIRSPTVLHLATHGFVWPKEADAPGGDRNARPQTGNPMLRCGLALAGAKRTLTAWSLGKRPPTYNDGILTAEDIACLNLHGTQLVVLSACDTGLGEAVAGEGVLGLRRGFIQAGAQNLLLTLWPIEDQQTADFMPEVYAAVHRTGSPSAAVAEVQGAWLKRLRKERGVAEACRIAGPFILSFQGIPVGSRMTTGNSSLAPIHDRAALDSK